MKKRNLIALTLFMLLPISSCGGSSNSLLPYIGENGNWRIGQEDTGVKAEGQDGTTPTIEISEDNYWVINGEKTTVKATGEDGKTPYIGENGNWWIDNKDTGIQAQGDKGEDGLTPYVGFNGNWWIGNQDTGIKVMGNDGEDGLTPSIGENGNWWIGEQDTGIKVTGNDGKDGLTPTIEISEDGYWVINGIKSDVRAEAQDGKDGITPTVEIGENGHWYINGEDTGKVATNLDYYRVTLNYNGGYVENGEMPTEFTVREGHTIENLPVPVKQDYEFLGWYSGTNPTSSLFTDSTQVYHDYNLTALYRSLVEDTFTISWVNYDGTLLERDFDVKYNTNPTYDGETPYKPSDTYAYEFNGFSPEIEPATKDMTYVAQFESVPLVFTINYELNGHGTLNNPITKVESGSSMSSPSLTMDENSDYGFAGWYLDESFISKVEFPFYPTSDTTLYARWEQIDETSFTYYSNEDGASYTIRSFNPKFENYDTIIIPSEYNGLPVTGIDNAFQNDKTIKNIVLPETLKNINDNAFRNTNLETINLPSSLETIGNYAFTNTDYLSVYIDDLSDLISIGDYSFYSSEIRAFDFTTAINLNYLGQCAFLDSKITSADFTNCTKISKIEYGTFQSCSNLNEIKLPKNLKIIDTYAFGWTNLKQIELPNQLEEIGYGSFYSTKLTQIILSPSIKTIGNDVFDFCTSLTIYSLTTSRLEGRTEGFEGDALIYYYSETEPTGPGQYWHYDIDGVTPIKR